MTTRTLTAALLLAVTAAAAAPVIARVASTMPAGPPPPATLPACQVAELPAERTGYDEWAETLLDTAYSLPPGYEPADLLPAEVGGRRIRLREFVIADLRAMLETARLDGVAISVTSGYRSYARQAAIFEQVSRSEGESQALRSVARPGHSEHQLGTAVDLSGGAEWLRQNAWQFGFVLSYPHGRSPAWTCYMPEPWHYRYFGRQRAAQMQASGYSPREWLWLQYHATNPVAYTGSR